MIDRTVARLLSEGPGSSAEVMAARAKSFHAAARFLPSRYRPKVLVLYHFCRLVDDVADDPRRDDARAISELNAVSAWLDGPILRAADEPGLAGCVARLVVEGDLDRRLLICLVDGVRSDRLRRERDDWDDLQRYCFQVAGSVGMLMAQVLGARTSEALTCAATLGVAMQLTNIIRDVGEDLDRGIVYLPNRELRRFGYDRTRLDRRVADDDFAALLRVHVGQAREHYASGLAGLHWLPADARFSIALAARLYAAILDEVEAQRYDVFRRRAATSALRKSRLLISTYGGLRLVGWLGRDAWPSGGDRLREVAAVVGRELGQVREVGT